MSSEASALITIVRAGAGAGKTRSLVHQVQNHFHHFFKEKKRAPRLIVTTFTRKATQELRERLLLKATQEHDWAFVEYLQSSDLFVTTIHGVLHYFLKKVSHLTGNDPSFQLLGEADLQRLSRRIMQKMVDDGEISTRWMSRYGFKRSQEMALEYVNNRAYQWPALTEEQFTEALLQHHQQLLEELKQQVSSLQLETEKFIQYQKELAQFLKSWPEDLYQWRNYYAGIPAKPRSSKTTVADAEKLSEVKHLLDKLEKFIEEDCVSEEEFRNTLDDIEEFEQWAKSFHDRFRIEKNETSGMSMQDLENLSMEILNDQPDLCRYFSSEWDYWLIDEFQDTSPIQMDILEKLTEGKPCYLVGDPQQSIYLFRGAKAEIFHKEWDTENRQRVELNKNYRSRPSLIHLAADIFSSPMVPAREEEQSTPVKVILCEKKSNQEDESFSSQEILAAVKELSDKKQQGATWSSMAVLARTHQELYALSLELRKRSIPFVLAGGQSFWERREIADLVQFLRFLINPHDNLNLISLLRSPWLIDNETQQGLSHQLLTEWAHASKDFSYWMSFQKQDHPIIGILKDYLLRAQSENLISLAEEFAAERGLLDSILALDPTGQKECQVWKLLTWLRQQERLPGWQILKTLQRLDESLLGDPGSAREVEAIQLMTIHASKGLEFDHVLLLGTGKAPSVTNHKNFSVDEEQKFWSFTVRHDVKNEFVATHFCRRHREHLREKERAESKRLFYVATTRAKESLILLGSGELKKDSWLSQLLKNDIATEGLVERNGYCLQIEKYQDSEVIETIAAPSDWTGKVRSLWQEEQPKAKSKAVSVTKLIAKPFPIDAVSAGMEKQQRGVQIHKLFEVLKYHSFDGVEQWMTSQGNHSAIQKNEFKKALNYVKTLKDIPFLQILQEGQSEWGFQVVLDQQWIEGQIDLWAEVEGHIWIIDYKTGSKAHVDSAWKQLHWYGQALQQLGFDKPQKHVVLYPLEETCLVREI